MVFNTFQEIRLKSMNYQKRRKVQKDYKWNVSHLQEFDPLETNDGFKSEIIEPKSENQTKNPWSVPSLQEFLKFVCPECDFNSKDENEFHWHTLDNHDKAKRIWAKSAIETNKKIVVELGSLEFQNIIDNRDVTT